MNFEKVFIVIFKLQRKDYLYFKIGVYYLIKLVSILFKNYIDKDDNL